MFDFSFGKNILYRISSVKVVVGNNTIYNETEFGEGENCSIEERHHCIG